MTTERSTRTGLRFVIESLESLVAAAVVLVGWPVGRRWWRDWGAHADERRKAWPGDQYVREIQATYTRAVAIRAPAKRIWPWLVQFGLGKAGFYSYELFERIAGIPVINVERILPEHQNLSVGDVILLHPDEPGIPVAEIEVGRQICFGMREDLQLPVPRSDPDRSWSMYLEPQPDNGCRLILRACIGPLREPTFLKRLGGMIEAPIDFLMEQRMLRTIRRLAESRRS